MVHARTSWPRSPRRTKPRPRRVRVAAGGGNLSGAPRRRFFLPGGLPLFNCRDCGRYTRLRPYCTSVECTRRNEGYDRRAGSPRAGKTPQRVWRTPARRIPRRCPRGCVPTASDAARVPCTNLSEPLRRARPVLCGAANHYRYRQSARLGAQPGSGGRPVGSGSLPDSVEMDKLFGWAAWHYSLGGNLDPDHPYASAPP